MMRYALAAFMIVVGAGGARASSERCLLQVDGKTYIKGWCAVMREDRYLMVGSDGERISNPYAATVSTNDDGSGDGHWNGAPGVRISQSPLGTMKRDGFCWINAKAKICAEP